MTKALVEMTPDQLTALIDERVERKLEEILGDPDEELTLLDSMRQRLLEQQQAVANGERGQSLEDVVAEMGLK